MQDEVVNNTLTPSEPPLVFENQQYALIIVVGPEGLSQKNKQFAFNVLGCFRTADEGHAFARKLNTAGYDMFDMFVVQTRKFCPLPPPTPTDLEDVHYQDHLLNTIMTEQRKRVDHSAKAVHAKVGEYAEKAESHNQERRKATDEERKRIKCVIGKPQTTPPPGVDVSKLQKLSI